MTEVQYLKLEDRNSINKSKGFLSADLIDYPGRVMNVLKTFENFTAEKSAPARIKSWHLSPTKNLTLTCITSNHQQQHDQDVSVQLLLLRGRHRRHASH